MTHVKQVTKIPATVSKYTAAPINSRAKRKVAGYARVSTDHNEDRQPFRKEHGGQPFHHPAAEGKQHRGLL